MPTKKQARDMASSRYSWHRKASKPVSFWMFTLFLVLMAHRWIPESLWLMVHIITLGLITNSILIWSQHFTEALLKNRLPDRARPLQLARIYSLNASILLLMAGILLPLYPLTILGSAGVGVAVSWHGLALLGQLRSALPSRFGLTVRYYIAAAWLLPLGATFGALLAYDGLSASWQGRLILAHEVTNLLGFVGITLVGTLLTLWPTMLRTVMLPDALSRSKQALTGLAAGLILALSGALTGLNWLAASGLLLYAAALGLVGALMIRTSASKKPQDYATFSVAAGISWLLIGLIISAYLVASSPFDSLSLRPVTPIFAVGFLAQTLLGAMSYLLPARMGGGPSAVRAANLEFNRFAAGRLSMINLSLLVFILPVSFTGSLVRTGAALLGAFTLFAFIPLMLRGVKASVRARQAMIQARAQGQVPSPQAQGLTEQSVPHQRNALIGSLVLLLVISLGLALDPAARARLFSPTPSSSASSSQVMTVTVEATSDMRFNPSQIEVPAGTHLLVEVKNSDAKNAHDLTFSNGASTGRINPGSSKTLDLGVIDGDLEGWCSVLGHQAMGMTFTLKTSS